MRNAIVTGVGRYPHDPPFDPGEASDPAANPVYEGLRRLFLEAGLDTDNAGSPSWNPLGDMIRPGDQVFIKPNMVLHSDDLSAPYEALVTHPSVIRFLLDHVAIALAGEGRILVGDSPLQGCELERLVDATGLGRVIDSAGRRAGVPVDLVDLRVHRARTPGGVIAERRTVENEWTETTVVDAGAQSLHESARGRAPLRVTNYDPRQVERAHSAGRHLYHVSSWILRSDVVIMVPKLKTHEKVGLTCCLKNAVGCCTRKDTLPHHRRGGTLDGGDEYPGRSRLKRVHTAIWERLDLLPSPARRATLDTLRKVVRRVATIAAGDGITRGAWHGNDTTWRTVHDLNRILTRADPGGRLHETPQRTVLHVVDGVTAGEAEGPLAPTPRSLGLLAAGTDPWLLDRAIAGCVGFSPESMPMLRRPGGERDDVLLVDGRETAAGDVRVLARLVPASGWRGIIERSGTHD